jgi:hypothetical protein
MTRTEVFTVRRIACCVVVLAAVLVLVAGCTPALSADEQAIRAIITRYNTLLADGYRALNMTSMSEVASQLQAEAEYIHMSSLAEGGIRLDSQLKQLEFVRVSIEATSAQAETRETWDYRQYSRATGALVMEQKGLVYHLAWDLAKQDGGTWLVTDVRAISSTATVEPTVLSTITPMPSGP